MITFTEENVKWLKLLIEQAEGKAEAKGEAEKVTKLRELSRKVGGLVVEDVEVYITEEKVAQVHQIIKELQYLITQYGKIADIGDLAQYDLIKKEMTVRLEFLMTCRNEFTFEASRLEDYLKKKLRTSILKEITETRKDENGKATSVAQADKLVEIDARYLSFKTEVQKIVELSDAIRSQYDFYMKMWQGVFQSVSTASKERFASMNTESA